MSGNAEGGEAAPDILRIIAKGDIAALEAALAQGADPNSRGEGGVTALGQAAALDQLGPLRLLLDQGAEVNQVSDAGNSPLMAAAARGHLEILQTLLDAGADVAVKNKWGFGTDDWSNWPPNAAEVRALLQAHGQ